MAKSVYIHIPFCKQKCKYCSFISYPNLDKIVGYIFSLLKEIDSYYNKEEIDTLYFGGGTPSLIELQYIKKIIDKFNLSQGCEITLEMNPDDANFEYLSGLYKIGINRLSIGAQSFDDKVLKNIGRRHNSEQIFEAIKMAKQAGFNNISVDLIYGLPEANLSNDLEMITSLDIKHVSTYGLKIEKESYWGYYPPHDLPDEDMQADMYLEVNNTLESKGFKRYEISNYALEGYESRHNLNYWNNKEYYGFGVAAHGYLDGIRYSNYTNLQEYMNNPIQHESGHILTVAEMLEEEIFLGFRKESGVNIKEINDKFKIDFEKKYKPVLDKYFPQYLEKTLNGYKLTIQGILLSNNVLAEFLE